MLQRLYKISPSLCLLVGFVAPAPLTAAIAVADATIVVSVHAEEVAAARFRILADDKRNSKPSDDASSAAIDVTPEVLRARLAADFRKYETKHFVVFSDADGATVRTLTGTLERTHHQFERSCRRLQLQPAELERKFSCILFNERPAFQQFAKKWDEISADWVGGYFANAGNYMVFYVAEDTPGMAEAEKQFDAWEVELAEIQSQIRAARAAGQTERLKQLEKYAAEFKAHINGERQRLDEFTNAEAEGRTIHETVHLLAFNTGIQIRERLAPFWLSEGLATNFESSSSRAAFGPDFENERRVKSFNELLRKGKLLPLRKLIGVSDATKENNQKAEILYQQSYALFRWLYRFRRAELGACFQLYAKPATAENVALPIGTLTEAQHHAAFEKIFGNIEKLEARWLRWERGQLK